ncbi:hypothetical protein D7193_15140 [Micromonospora costi]|uniref:Uncharacterized protein n=1 Tax=Micromonospora costi TaxID=1530042 RepID=A0A3B0A680_9ACTN|nr:hypothetical protein D7193_15140 [Micromonospora costi]
MTAVSRPLMVIERRPVPGFVRRSPPSQGCGAGVVPCGRPARLYACGWRCVEHPPVGRAGGMKPAAEVAAGSGGAG